MIFELAGDSMVKERNKASAEKSRHQGLNQEQIQDNMGTLQITPMVP